MGIPVVHAISRRDVEGHGLLRDRELGDGTPDIPVCGQPCHHPVRARIRGSGAAGIAGAARSREGQRNRVGAPVRDAHKLGGLGLAGIHEVRLGKRHIRLLRRHRQREAGNTRLTSGIGAHDVEAEHSSALRRSHDPHRAILGDFQAQALGQRTVGRNGIRIRRGAAGGGIDSPNVFAMRSRNGQPARVERQILPLGYGHFCPLGVDRRHGSQIRLHDAAIVRTRIRRRSASQRQRRGCFALKRLALAAALGHAEPLISQLVRRRGPARNLLVGKDVLGGVGSNRKRDRFALMHAGALRLRLHHGLARAGERERQLLRRLDAVQSRAVASALVIGYVELDGICGRAVIAHAGQGRALQVAPHIGRGRERDVAAPGHGHAGRINRAVGRRRLHRKHGRLRKTRRHRHVIIGRERPGSVRAQRVGPHGAIFPDRIPAIEYVAFIGHGTQRVRGAVLHLLDHGTAPLIVIRRAIDMPAVTRVDRHNVPRSPFVIRRVGLIRHRRPHDQRAEAHRRAAFVDPIAELPTGERDGHHPRRRQVAVAGEGHHHGEARAGRIGVHLQVKARVVEHRRQLHILLGDAHVHGVVAQNGARIVDPMREAVGGPRDGHGHERVALVQGLRSAS